MSHRGHWRAIDSDPEAFVRRLLPEVLPETLIVGSVIGKKRRLSAESGVEGDGRDLLLIQHPGRPLGCLAICSTDGKDEYRVEAAFPLCGEGVVNRLRILDVEPDGGLHEGVVHASGAGGMAVSFFDPYFFLRREVPAIGGDYDVELAGLAYLVRKAKRSRIVIDSGDNPRGKGKRRQKGNQDADFPSRLPLQVLLKGMTMFLPQENGAEADFRAPVESVEQFSSIGCEYCRIRVTFRGAEDDTLMGVQIYAAAPALGSYLPRTGEDVEGVIWMQGRFRDQGEMSGSS
jgi:hypothetical protein